MTIVNTQLGKNNSTGVLTLSITDTNEHDFPDVDGDDSAGGDAFVVSESGVVLAKVVNNQDQDTTARLEGTTSDDVNFDEADVDVSDVTVASGGVETLESRHNWQFVRVVVSFDTAPTGTNDTKVVFRASTR